MTTRSTSSLPSAFKRTRRSLEVLNIGGVGFALAAATSAILGSMFSHGERALIMAFATGMPTLLIGTLWAWLLRQKNRVHFGSFSVRLGWVLAIPLAMINAGVALGMTIALETSGPWLENFGLGMLLGATFGALVWIPALLLTILCFGAPIAWAGRQAERGLSGRERGEFAVGTASLVIATLALLIARTENPFSSALGVLGLLTSAFAIFESFSRLRARKRFINDVEAGHVKHFRIDPTEEGRALVRIVSQGEDYRVADYEEEVAALDEEGNVTATHLR